MTVNLIRAVIIYVFVIVAVRLMGKRTVGELNPHELVITILLSAIAVIPLEENSMPLANCLVPILLFVSLEIIVACVSLKSVKIRNFVQGRPIMIIKDGKLDQSKLAQLRFTIDDVVDALRQKDVFDISQVQQAVIETNGSISVLLKAEYQPMTLNDAEIKVEEKGMPIVVATDGKIVTQYFNEYYVDKKQIEGLLKDLRLDESQVMLLTVDGLGNTYIIKKEEK